MATASQTFSRLGPNSARVAYLHSFAFFEYLARSHGERKLDELVSTTLRTGNFERAFRRTYRADLYGEVSTQLASRLNASAGVLAVFSGPSYETPAEVRYLEAVGADAVGMSTDQAMSTVRENHQAMISWRIMRWLLRVNRAASPRNRL